MAKVPGIYVEVKGDYGQLQKDISKAKDIVTGSAREMSDSLNNALAPGQLKQSINKLIGDLSTLSNASKVTGQTFGKLGVDLGELRKVTGMTDAQFKKLQQQLLQTQAAKAQETALRNIAKSAGMTQKEIATLGKQFGLSKGQIESVSGAAKNSGSAFSVMGGAAKMALAYLSVSSLASFAKSVLDVTIKVDSLERSFTAITGSTAGMRNEFDFLRETADRTGQNFYNLTDSYAKLIASSRETALEGQKTRDIFSAMSEAAAVLGMSQEGVERSLNALSQMMSKGTVQSEELKGQLGDHLPGALNIAANAMGLTTKQLMKMMETGDVLASDLLPKMAAEIHKMYGEAAETAALQSGQAAVNRLSQAWTDLKANLIDSDQAVAGINKIVSVLKAVGEAANLRSVWGTYQQGAELARKGLLDFQKFSAATFTERQKMVDDLINSENVAANHFGTVWQRVEEQGMREYQQYVNGHEQAVASAYEAAYGVIGGMTDSVYEKMKQKYAEDRDAFIALTGDKAAAQAVYLKKVDELDKKKSGKTGGTSKASDANAAAQAELELLKATEEKKLAAIRASLDEQSRANEHSYELGLTSYSEYLNKKNKLTQDGLREDLAAKERELAAAKQTAASLKQITDKDGNARPDKDAKATADAYKNVEDAERAVIEARNKLTEAEVEGNHAAAMAAKETENNYKQIEIQLAEMQGNTVEAARLMEEYDEETVERQRLIADAANKNEAAQRALNAERLMGATRIRQAELDQLRAQKESLLSLAQIDGEYYKSLDIQTDLLDIEIERAELAGELPEHIALLRRQRNELEMMKNPLTAFVKGWRDVVKEQQTVSEQMYDIATDTARDLQDAFSDTFFSVMKGDFESIGDIWDNLLDRMLDNFIRMLADMAAAWAANEVFEFIFGSGAGASFSVSGSGGSSGGNLVGGVASMAVQAAAKKYLLTPAYNAVAEYIGGTAMSSTAAATGGSVAAGATSTSISAGTATPAIMDAYATGVGAGSTAGASAGATAAPMSAYAGPAAIAAMAAAVMIGIATNDKQERDRLNNARITPTGFAQLGGINTNGELTNMTKEAQAAVGSLIGMMGSFAQISVDAEAGVVVLGEAIRDTSDAQTGLITGMNYQIETFNNATGVWEKSKVNFGQLVDQMRDLRPTTSAAIRETAQWVATMNGIPTVADELAQAFTQMSTGIYGLGGATATATGTIAGAIDMMANTGLNFQAENERWADTGRFDAINFGYYDGPNAARDSGGTAPAQSFVTDDLTYDGAKRVTTGKLIQPGWGTYADGGIHYGGWRLVGERGPELEYTPPSRIFSNTDTKSILSGLAGNQREQSQQTVIHNHFYVDGKEVATQVKKINTDQAARGFSRLSA